MADGVKDYTVLQNGRGLGAHDGQQAQGAGSGMGRKTETRKTEGEGISELFSLCNFLISS